MAATGMNGNGNRGFSRILKVTRDDIRGVTPNEMRQIRDMSGLPLSEIMDETNMDSADVKSQMTAWLVMRRAGTPCTWEEAGDFLIEEVEAAAPDPTNAGSTTPSPASAGTGA